MNKIQLDHLRKELDGELQSDDLTRSIYATDASVYRKLPLAVAYPESEDDIRKIVRFARDHEIGLIPRTAGGFSGRPMHLWNKWILSAGLIAGPPPTLFEDVLVVFYSTEGNFSCKIKFLIAENHKRNSLRKI